MKNTMNPMVRICTYSLALLLTSATAWAQAEADDIRGRVKEGQKVSVTDNQGREFNGRITTLAADSLTLTLDKAPRVVVPYAQIIRIDRPHDTLVNGALIGFGVGAALGLGGMVAEDARSCDPGAFFDCSDPPAGGYIAATLFVGALGTAVGVGVDALIHRDRGIYRRGGSARVGVSPVLARSRRGAVLSLSW